MPFEEKMAANFHIDVERRNGSRDLWTSVCGRKWCPRATRRRKWITLPSKGHGGQVLWQKKRRMNAGVVEFKWRTLKRMNDDGGRQGDFRWLRQKKSLRRYIDDDDDDGKPVTKPADLHYHHHHNTTAIFSRFKHSTWPRLQRRRSTWGHQSVIWP
ncbi:unnamed protein product [Nippostrongylus brasiliensis]|uniref:Uncharacterized protein n=1 Tax=Nippostrongylus brasiliensis TaxID=27835 RepID=A0A0N4XDQ1_NIPBR|nr:unnamed protein product [Nippostrongylus brasiliensis]